MIAGCGPFSRLLEFSRGWGSEDYQTWWPDPYSLNPQAPPPLRPPISTRIRLGFRVPGGVRLVFKCLGQVFRAFADLLRICGVNLGCFQPFLEAAGA